MNWIKRETTILFSVKRDPEVRLPPSNILSWKFRKTLLVVNLTVSLCLLFQQKISSHVYYKSTLNADTPANRPWVIHGMYNLYVPCVSFSFHSLLFLRHALCFSVTVMWSSRNAPSFPVKLSFTFTVSIYKIGNCS